MESGTDKNNNPEHKNKEKESGIVPTELDPTLGFSTTGSSLRSVEIRDTDFLGGRAGTMSSPTEGSGTESSPTLAPFTAPFVGRPPEFRVG